MQPTELTSIYIPKLDLNLEIGDLIELSDKMGLDYYPIYNIGYNRYYEVFESDQDFKYVFIEYFYENNKRLKVRRLFSKSESKIISIIKNGNNVIVYTPLFGIDLFPAIEESEILIHKNKEQDSVNYEWDILCASQLRTSQQDFDRGWCTNNEAFNMRTDICYVYMGAMIEKGKWKTRK